jgi:hypothetical protein
METSAKQTEIPASQLQQVVNPWLIGADPEFFVIQPPDRPIYNMDPYLVNVRTPAGEIGWDHGQRIWELRPHPAQSSYGLITNIWKLLRPTPDAQGNDTSPLYKVAKFKWKSGAVSNDGDGDTIGGHVHFGMRTLAPATLNALADLTVALERIEILPSEESAERRNLHPEYGALTGTRDSKGHVEYRAPASWLDKPGQALAVLTTYKLAVHAPESLGWTKEFHVKSRFEDWVTVMSQRDVDAFILYRLLEKRKLGACQAEPGCDFGPNWRKEYLWTP